MEFKIPPVPVHPVWPDSVSVGVLLLFYYEIHLILAALPSPASQPIV